MFTSKRIYSWSIWNGNSFLDDDDISNWTVNDKSCRCFKGCRSLMISARIIFFYNLKLNHLTISLNNFAMLAFDLQCCYNNILTKQTTEQKTNTVSNSNDYSDHVIIHIPYDCFWKEPTRKKTGIIFFHFIKLKRKKFLILFI